MFRNTWESCTGKRWPFPRIHIGNYAIYRIHQDKVGRHFVVRFNQQQNGKEAK